MPRRTNDGIKRLHAQAVQQKEEKQVTVAALPPSAEPEPFDFDLYCRQTKASKIVLTMRGNHYAGTRHGRALAEKIDHHLEAGEVLEIRKLQDRHTFNRIPTHHEMNARMQRRVDSARFADRGLF